MRVIPHPLFQFELEVCILKLKLWLICVGPGGNFSRRDFELCSSCLNRSDSLCLRVHWRLHVLDISVSREKGGWQVKNAPPRDLLCFTLHLPVSLCLPWKYLAFISMVRRSTAAAIGSHRVFFFFFFWSSWMETIANRTQHHASSTPGYTLALSINKHPEQSWITYTVKPPQVDTHRLWTSMSPPELFLQRLNLFYVDTSLFWTVDTFSQSHVSWNSLQSGQPLSFMSFGL